MLIIVPVSSYEFQKPLSVLGFIKSLRHFGFYPNHDLLVVSRPSDKHFARSVFDLIKDQFPNKANLHLFKQGDGTSGWPQGPNCYWKYTIEYLKEIDNKQPWFWMELDCIALKPKWADILEEAYHKCGKPCFGTIQNTTNTTEDGYVVNIAKHLQGTAVYPPKFHEICSIWEYVDGLSTAFDVVTQWEVIPNTADTKLIQQGFRTLNYKIHKDPYRIQGEDNGDLGGAVKYDDPLHPEAVVHHGCKDTSLADIVASPEYDSWLNRNEI
jgi:hypothetical protein